MNNNDFQKKLQEAREKNSSPQTSNKTILNTYSEIKDEIKKTTKPILKKISRYFVSTLITVLVIFFVSFKEVLTGEINPGYILTLDFWVGYAPFVMAQYIIIFVVSNTEIKYLVDNDIEYNSKKDEIKKFVELDYASPFIEKACLEETLNNKKRAIQFKMHKKLSKRFKKLKLSQEKGQALIKKSILGQELNAEEEFLLKSIKITDKLKKRLETNIKPLLCYFDNEWLDKNIHNIKIKHTIVTKETLTLGIKTQTSERVENYIYSQTAAILSNNKTFGVIFTIAIGFLSMIDFSFKERKFMEVIFDIFWRTLMLILLHITTKMNAKSAFNNSKLREISVRENRLRKMYLDKEKLLLDKKAQVL